MTGLASATFSGRPYDRGVQHGERFAAEIGANAAFYLEHFADEGVPEGTAREHARRSIEGIEEYNADYAACMRGVADGSGVALEEVTLVNVRHTVLYSAYAGGLDAGRAREPAVEGCTSFALEPSVTASGHTVIGQNWDWKAPVESFVMRVEPEDAPDRVVVTEAGNVGGKFGVNEHGVGFVVNGLSTPEDGRHPERKPGHVRGWEILDAGRLDEAIGPVVGSKRPTSRNYVFGHPEAGVIDIETTPDECRYVYPDGGVLTHANHFVHRDGIESTLEHRIPHTLTRQVRIRSLLRGFDGPITEEDVKGVLRDHVGYPNSLCRHTHEAAPLSQTNASAIIDLDDRRILVTGGPPCETAFQEFRVSA